MSLCANPAAVQPADLSLDQVRARMAPYQSRITELKRRYPTRRAVLLQVLHLAQQEFGWVPRVAIEWAAEVAETSAVHAFSVVEFYTMYRQVPMGRHLVQVCQTMCCHIQGAEDLIEHLESKLGIHAGGTTADGLFSLVRVECLALCGSGPGVMIDDQAIGPVPHPLNQPGKLREAHLEVPDFHPTPAVLDAWLDFLRSQAVSENWQPQWRGAGGGGGGGHGGPSNPPVVAAGSPAPREKRHHEHDAIGDIVLETKGHPQGQGATAQVLPVDYAPAAPALKLAAKVEGGNVALSWLNDQSLAAKVVVERSDDGGASWREIASVGPRDQKAADKLESGTAAQYRVTAHEKTRAARPSAVVSVTGA